MSSQADAIDAPHHAPIGGCYERVLLQPDVLPVHVRTEVVARMSVWIVSKAHIDVLVHALGKRELLEHSPDRAGVLLWAQNHVSVNYLYDESTLTPEYTYVAPVEPWSADEILCELRCYDYQSCEHPGYETSVAWGYLTELEAALEREGATRDSAESQAAPWGVPDCGHKHADHLACPYAS